MQALDNDLSLDPNLNYDKLENIIRHCKDKHLPTKTVRFNLININTKNLLG